MLYLDRKGWTVFTVEERYWFARLLLECFFWNNFADDDTYAKYNKKEETRELHTPVFGRYSSALREAIWWKILLCACYESIKGETAVIESGTGAIIDIIEELLFGEIELVSDLLEEDIDFSLWHYTRYRILVESISRSLMKRWDEDEEEEQLLSELPTPQEILELTDKSHWRDRLDDLEILFTAYDQDYTFGANLPSEAMDFLNIEPKYYDEKTILGELQKDQEYGYWDLLCLCLEKKPLPPLSKVKKQRKEANWFLSLEKYLSKKRLKMVESLVITNCFVLSP